MDAPDRYFEKGDQAAKRRNFDYAIDNYMQGLTLAPFRPEERKKLHQIYALKIEQDGGNLKGGFTAAGRRSITLLKTKKKDPEKAIIEWEAYLKTAPQDAQALICEADIFAALDQGLDSAVALLEEVVSLDRHHIDGLKKLGRLYERKGDSEAAIRCWERVKQSRPDDKEAGKAIRDLSAATMVKTVEERKAAGGDSYRALLKDEDEAKKLEEAAHIIRTDEDAKKAIARMMEKMKADPKAVTNKNYRDLGDLLTRIKQFDKAEKCYENALKLEPRDLYAVDRLGRLKEARYDDRLTTLRERMKTAPDDAVRAELETLEREVDAWRLEEYGRRVQAHPTDYGLRLSYGEILMGHRQWDEAVAQFQKSVQDPRHQVRSHQNLGRCFVEKKLYDLAITQLTSALRGVADPSSELSKTIKYNLASAHELKGDREKARKLYEEILAIDIGFRDVAQKVDELGR